ARSGPPWAGSKSSPGGVPGCRNPRPRPAGGVPREPPPALRAAVMGEVARTSQLPAPDDGARYRRPVPRRIVLPRLAVAGAAVGVAAAIALGVVLVNTQNQLDPTQRQLGQARRQLATTKTQLAAINAVRTAADATLVAKATTIGGTVTVVKSASMHEIVVTTHGLPPPRAGKVYQLWLIGTN